MRHIANVVSLHGDPGFESRPLRQFFRGVLIKADLEGTLERKPERKPGRKPGRNQSRESCAVRMRRPRIVASKMSLPRTNAWVANKHLEGVSTFSEPTRIIFSGG